MGRWEYYGKEYFGSNHYITKEMGAINPIEDHMPIEVTMNLY